jgi:hypothetical protein
MAGMTTRKSETREIEAPADELSDEEFMREMGIEPPTPEGEAEFDAWFERNKDAFLASLKEADEAYERDEYSPLEDVMARVRARILAHKN